MLSDQVLEIPMLQIQIIIRQIMTTKQSIKVTLLPVVTFGGGEYLPYGADITNSAKKEQNPASIITQLEKNTNTSTSSISISQQ